MTIIFLNGAGSSGKSSIVKAIQHLSEKAWLTFGIDTFFTMLLDQYTGFNCKAFEGFQFIAKEQAGKPVVTCEAGPLGNKLVETMPKFVKLMADQGFDLIVDEVLIGNNKIISNYANNLKEHKVYFIGVNCTLEAIEEREFLRGDRAIGLSRDQYDKVHNHGIKYDIEVDTTHNSSFNCAKTILEFVNANPDPKSFKAIK